MIFLSLLLLVHSKEESPLGPARNRSSEAQRTTRSSSPSIPSLVPTSLFNHDPQTSFSLIMKLLIPSFLVALAPLLVAADQLRFANPSASTDPITSFSSSTKVLNSHSSKVKLSEINSPDGFTTLEHDEFPSHSIRIKETTVSP